MFSIKVDRLRAVISYELEGRLEDEELRRFDHELAEVLGSLQGREIRMKADLRGLKPVSPEAAERLRRLQAYALDCGAMKLAEIVDNHEPLLSLQLGRIARESGCERITRRFPTDGAARDWLEGEG